MRKYRADEIIKFMFRSFSRFCAERAESIDLKTRIMVITRLWVVYGKSELVSLEKRSECKSQTASLSVKYLNERHKKNWVQIEQTQIFYPEWYLDVITRVSTIIKHFYDQIVIRHQSFGQYQFLRPSLHNKPRILRFGAVSLLETLIIAPITHYIKPKQLSQ